MYACMISACVQPSHVRRSFRALAMGRVFSSAATHTHTQGMHQDRGVCVHLGVDERLSVTSPAVFVTSPALDDGYNTQPAPMTESGLTRPIRASSAARSSGFAADKSDWSDEGTLIAACGASPTICKQEDTFAVSRYSLEGNARQCPLHLALTHLLWLVRMDRCGCCICSCCKTLRCDASSCSQVTENTAVELAFILSPQVLVILADIVLPLPVRLGVAIRLRVCFESNTVLRAQKRPMTIQHRISQRYHKRGYRTRQRTYEHA